MTSSQFLELIQLFDILVFFLFELWNDDIFIVCKFIEKFLVFIIEGHGTSSIEFNFFGGFWFERWHRLQKNSGGWDD